MINLIQMDLYRMFRTKSMYVIWTILILTLLLTTMLDRSEYKEAADGIQEEQAVLTEENIEAESGENMNIGMSVVLPTEPGEKVTVYDVVFANTQGKPMALFIVIFAVLFTTADFNNGYIKNIAGQIATRGRLIVVKALSLFVYILLSFGILTLFQAIFNQILYGYLEWGDVNKLISYLVTEVLLHFALALICMTIAVISRRNVISMIIGVCLCMNVMFVIYSGIDKLVHKIGWQDIEILDYSISARISSLPMDFTGKESFTAMGLAMIFIVFATLLGSIVFEKRDI